MEVIPIRRAGKTSQGCRAGGLIVDLYKIIDTECDFFDESVEFFCLSAHRAEAISA